MKKIILVVVSMMLLLTAVLCSCGETEYTPTVTAPAYAQPITEAMLQALSQGDYQGYCLFITPNMSSRTTEEIWGYFKDFYKARIGDFISLQLYDVVVETASTTVIYWAKYSKADKVTITIVFVPVPSGDAMVVDVLTLDSPELRATS